MISVIKNAALAAFFVDIKFGFLYNTIAVKY